MKVENSMQVIEESRLIMDGPEEVINNKIRSLREESLKRRRSNRLSEKIEKYRGLSNKHDIAFRFLALKWFLLSRAEISSFSEIELRALHVIVGKKAKYSLAIYLALILCTCAVPVLLIFLTSMQAIDVVMISIVAIVFAFVGSFISATGFDRGIFSILGFHVFNYLRGRRAIKKLSDKSDAHNGN